MRVTTISVSSQCRRPSTHSDFATDSVLLSLTAELLEGDDLKKCVRKLQRECDSLAFEHIEGMQMRETFRRQAQKEHAAAQRSQAATAVKTAQLAAKHGGTF